MKTLRQELVYDLPTRLFHWLFAGLFLSAFIIAKNIDDESIWFSYHSLAGLTLGFLVSLRILWGLFGTKHARFSGFALNPMELVKYLKGILTGSKDRWAGHNPASSWAGLMMMALAMGLAVTGYLMTSGPDKETFEDAHELFADGLIIIAILHVAGIALHTLRHREMIGLSMVDGKKAQIAKSDTIESSKTPFGILLLGLVVAFGIYLFKSFDSEAGSLHAFGVKLQIGENQANDGESDGEGE
jgi:cytochrome b